MKYIFFILIFILISCSKKEDFKKHEKLIYYKSKFISEFGSNNYDKLLSKTKSKINAKYLGDIIYVTKYIETNSCGNYIGNIEIKKDSIYLVYKLVSDEVCMSTAIEKITYIIENPKEKKYKFSLRWK